jgi:ABC-type transporter Mla subunit MlaD
MSGADGETPAPYVTISFEVFLLLAASSAGVWLAWHPTGDPTSPTERAWGLVVVAVVVGLQTAAFAGYLWAIRRADREEREAARRGWAAGGPAAGFSDMGDVIADTGSSAGNSMLVLGVGLSAAGLLLWGLLGASFDSLLAGVPRAFLSTGLAVFSGLNLNLHGQSVHRAYRIWVRALALDHAKPPTDAEADEKGPDDDPILKAQQDLVAKMEALVGELKDYRPTVHVHGGASELEPLLRRQVEALNKLVQATTPLSAAAAQEEAGVRPLLESLRDAAKGQAEALKKLSGDAASLLGHTATIRAHADQLVAPPGPAPGLGATVRALAEGMPKLQKATEDAGKQSGRVAEQLGKETAGILEQHRDLIRKDTLELTRAAMVELVKVAVRPLEAELQELSGKREQQVEAAHQAAFLVAQQRLQALHTQAREGLNDSAKSVNDASTAMVALNVALRSLTGSVGEGATGLKDGVPKYQEATRAFSASAEEMLGALARGTQATGEADGKGLVRSLDAIARSLLASASALTAATGQLSSTVNSLAEHLARQEQARRAFLLHLDPAEPGEPSRPVVPPVRPPPPNTRVLPPTDTRASPSADTRVPPSADTRVPFPRK